MTQLFEGRGLHRRTGTVASPAIPSVGLVAVTWTSNEGSVTATMAYQSWYTPVAGDIVQVLVDPDGSMLCLGTVAAGAAVNYLGNPSFETVSGGLPIGWTFYNAGGYPAASRIVDTVTAPYHGVRTLKFSPTGSTGMGAYAVQDPAFPVVTGQTFKLSTYAKGSAAISHATPPLSLWMWYGTDEVVAPGSAGYSETQVASSNLTTGWVNYASGTITVPSGKTWARGVVLVLTQTAVTASVWLDLVELKRLS